MTDQLTCGGLTEAVSLMTEPQSIGDRWHHLVCSSRSKEFTGAYYRTGISWSDPCAYRKEDIVDATAAHNLLFWMPLSELWRNKEPLWEARKAIEKQKNRDLAQKAMTFLSALEKVLNQVVLLHSGLSKLPRLLTLANDSDSLWFEWIFPHYRLGFSIDLDPEESGWYLVSDEELGRMNATGLLSEADIVPLLTWLLVFIALQS